MTNNIEWDQRDADLRRQYGISFDSDGSVPGADSFGRYAVLSHREGKNHNLTRAANLAGAQKVAASCIGDGEWIEGMYDLATLEGPEPDPDTCDLVMFQGERYRVIGVTYDETTSYDLIDADDWDEEFWEGQPSSAYAPIHHLRIIERGPEYEEHREPVLHTVGGVILTVRFNNIEE